MSVHLSTLLSLQPVIHHYKDKEEEHYGLTMTINAIHAKEAGQSITPEEMCKMLHIGLQTAKRTLNATTASFICTTGSMTRRFRTDKAHLRYKQLSKVFGSFYCDYLKSKVKSVRGYIGGVLYTNRIGFHKFIPCDSEKGEQTSRTLKHFIHVIGLPYSLHCDNHANFKQGLFSKLMKKFGIFQTFTEPHSPWQNRAEAAIGDVKRYARKIMQATDTPIRLWCFAYEYSADLHSLLATSRFDLQGCTPYEVVMHYTPDISEYISFSWFQWCWYFDEGSKEKVLCRWLGPAHQVGQSFCFWILKSNSEFIARSTVILVLEHDLISDEMKERRDTFMHSVEARIGNAKQPLFNLADPDHIYYDAFDHFHEAPGVFIDYDKAIHVH